MPLVKRSLTNRFRLTGILRIPVALLLLALCMTSTAHAAEKSADQALAETSGAAAMPRTQAEAQIMVARLSDEQVRALLLAKLTQGLEPAAQQLPSAPWLLSGSPIALRELSAIFAEAPRLGTHLSVVADKLANNGRSPWLAIGLVLLTAILLGFIVERWLWQPRSLLGRLAATRTAELAVRSTFGAVVVHTLACAAGVLAFVATALIVVTLTPGLSPSGRTLASGLLWIIGGGRLIAAIVRATLDPMVAAARPRLSAATAKVLRLNLTSIGCVTLAHAIIRDLLRQMGADPHFATMITLVTGLAIIVSVTVGILAVRTTTRSADLEARSTGLLAVFRSQWHLLAIAYIYVIYVFSIFKKLISGETMLAPALLSLALMLAIPVLDLALRELVAWFMRTHSAQKSPISIDAHSDAPENSVATHDLPPTVEPNRYQYALILNLRVLLGIALVAALTQLWGIDITAVIEGVFGARAAAAAFQIAIVMVFALLLWQVMKATLEMHDSAQDAAQEVGGIGGVGLTRTQTLMPLVAKTVGVTLIVMVALIGLSAFGVDIGPLLAGAGVVGIAVGFGAQTLVRDVMSGIFFLVDDAFRMGEYLEIGNIRGTVEKISPRSLRLRHHNGPLHTLPYGEIKNITNYSRDYAVMKFDLRVSFETDVEKVRKVIKRVGEEMAMDEELQKVMLEPLKSSGVSRMDDSAFVVRCKFMTTPGKQFGVRRIAFAKIQEAFEANGIKFAPRRVVVETIAADASSTAAAAGAAAADVEPQSGG